MSLIKEIKVFYFGIWSSYICIVNEAKTERANGGLKQLVDDCRARGLINSGINR